MKKIIFYGNCHMTALKAILLQIEEFNNNYEVIDIKPIQEIEDIEQVCKKFLDECDVFIHQCIQDNNKYGYNYSSKKVTSYLKKDCQIIACPNLYGLPKFIFPMYKDYSCFYSILKSRGALFYRDIVIDDMFSKGIRIEKIAENYDYACKELMKDSAEQYELFVKKVKLREKEWDIQISDFIVENLTKRHLFFDPNHPTSTLIKKIAQEILVHLNIDFSEKELEEVASYELDRMAMPIPASVGESLNLEYEVKELRPNGGKIGFQYMDNKQYVIEYCAFEWQNKELRPIQRAYSFYKYLVLILKNIPMYIRHIIQIIFRI